MLVNRESENFLRVGLELTGNEGFMVGVEDDCRQLLPIPDRSLRAPRPSFDYNTDELTEEVTLEEATEYVATTPYRIFETPLELVLLHLVPKRDEYTKTNTQLVAARVLQPPRRNRRQQPLATSFTAVAQRHGKRLTGQAIYLNEVVELPRTGADRPRVLALKPTPGDSYEESLREMVEVSKSSVAKQNKPLGKVVNSLPFVAAPLVRIGANVSEHHVIDLRKTIEKRLNPRVPFYIGNLLVYAQKQAS